MDSNIGFMRQLEDDYRKASGLQTRRHYKIFYGQVFPAPILTLGINPGGDPEGTSDDGMRQKNGSPASASASFFEELENDVLDCEWRENTGLRKLLLPLVGRDYDRFRREVVKTNVAFRRSTSSADINMAAAAVEAAPFLDRIITRVRPRVILLTGGTKNRFLRRHAAESVSIARSDRLANAPSFVFSAERARLTADNLETIVVQVAHASRFAWTYDRHHVPDEIALLMGHPTGGGKGDRAPTALLKRPEPKPNTTGQPITMPQPLKPDLAELEAKWRLLGITTEFYRVHHFSHPGFSGKRETLGYFIKYCESHEIGDQNQQTLARALDVARRVGGGQSLESALDEAWQTFPIITK